jgi:hypothetical protein
MKNKVLLFVLFITLCVGVYAQESVYTTIAGEELLVWYKPDTMPTRTTLEYYIEWLKDVNIGMGYPNVNVRDVTYLSTKLKKKADREYFKTLVSALRNVAIGHNSAVAWIDLPNWSNVKTFVVYTSDNKWYTLDVILETE